MTTMTTAPDAPDLEYQCPPCSLCGKETTFNDGLDCDDCGARWDETGAFSGYMWGDDSPESVRCEAEVQVDDTGVHRCLKTEGHIDGHISTETEHCTVVDGVTYEWGGNWPNGIGGSCHQVKEPLTKDARDGRDKAASTAELARLSEKYGVPAVLGARVRTSYLGDGVITGAAYGFVTVTPDSGRTPTTIDPRAMTYLDATSMTRP